jgi:transforming growth factor-beta-induced protein
MKSISKFATGILTFAFVFSLAFISTANSEGTSKETSESNIVEIAIADDRFSILVEAVSKAGLVDALSADGPFTVFAPTNDAFEKLFEALGVSGVSELTAEQLTPILLYHVVSGEVMSADVKTGKVATLNEEAWMSIEADQSGVVIDNNSQVIISDVKGSNGVIHVIDNVLVPETKTKAKTSSGGCG